MTIPLNNDPTVASLPPPSAPILPPPAYDALPQRDSRSEESTNHNSMYNDMSSTRYQDDVALALAMSIQDQELNATNPSVPIIDSNSMFQASHNAVAQTVEEDAEIAKRIQQEERDAQIARELHTSEQRRGSIRVEATTGDTYQDSPPDQKSCGKKFCSAFIVLSVVAGGIMLILFYGSTIWQKVGGNPADLPPFFQDTWDDNIGNGTSVGTFSRWHNRGNGLQLTLVNGLTSDWYPYFSNAVNDWNACPALDLSTNTIEPAQVCNPISGQMKVCNAEYGFTSWTGLNEVYFEGNGAYIVSSVAKMNESYLRRSSKEEKQYVMCHEMGHGFGLPHRDESTNNPDLGTCLDYTRTPANNMQPDEIDFSHLIEIYGQRRGRKMPSLRSRKEEDVSRFERIVSKKRHYKEGRLLHRSGRQEVYESNLGGDIRMITTVLLAT